MDFKVGGKRLYAMVSPDGQERWIVQEYLSISPKNHFRMFNAFSDPEGNTEPTGSEWDFSFREQDGKTIVRITICNESLERMEKMIEMGFVEGYKATMLNLDELLAAKTKN